MMKTTLYKSLTFLFALMLGVGLAGSVVPSSPGFASKAQPVLPSSKIRRNTYIKIQHCPSYHRSQLHVRRR
jgi:hypothetical protein